ncbi:unnamed protein product [Trichogramma brassicae]|uniref:CCHC-type domain-containing protein n=1 Tax=Trichogramma brassicae TaxID=86971 RepID=A0A6H5IQ79_9HYME|nr:unnamed protein product [Trichogramma brassicae]
MRYSVDEYHFSEELDAKCSDNSSDTNDEGTTSAKPKKLDYVHYRMCQEQVIQKHLNSKINKKQKKKKGLCGVHARRSACIPKALRYNFRERLMFLTCSYGLTARNCTLSTKARATHGMSTAVSEGLRSPQGQTSVEKPGGPSLMELGPLPTPRTSPYTMMKAITGKIIVAPLHCKEKDAKLLSPAEFATGTLEDKLERLDGLIRGLGQFIQGKSNLHKEVISYQVSLGMALSALRKSLESQVPPRPPVADKAVCTSPLFTGSATSKRLATSPPASHATPKRHAVTPASKQHDENNNEVGDQDGFVLVDRRRHRQRKQTAATPVAVHARQQPKPRPVQRRARHRPDVIVIKAKDASKYADILRSLKSDPTLQQKVGSSVNNIRRSAAGALMLQLKKGVENASDLGDELGKVLGTAATASALLHTSSIEIKDLDECATKEEVTAALDALLGVPVSERDPAKSLRKAYAGTQVAVVALPDDLAATALKLGHVRIGWVNCGIRAREEAARCYRCWSPGHVAARCKGPDHTELCNRCGQKGHQAKDCKGQPSSPRTADDENPPAQPQSLRGCPGPALRHHQQAAHRRGHLVRAIQEPCSTQHMARRCRRPSSYLGAWRNSGAGAPSASTSLLRVGPNRRIFFFSVYAPPRLSEREFSAPSLPTSPRRPAAEGPLLLRGTSTHGRRTHRSLPGPRRIWRRASCPSSPAHVMPRCPRQILAAVVSRCTGGRPRSLISGALACGPADSSRDRRAGMTKKPTARTTPQQGVFCAWRSRPANVGAGGSFATRSTTTSGANHTGLPCHTPRMPAGQAAQLPLLVRSAVAALFPRVPSGPALRLPRRAEELIPAVTLEELKGAQSRIKERSAPGPDGIPNPALKIAIAVRPDIFLRVYTMCLETGVFPSGWKRQRLVLLPKPGKPPDEPSSYRPLCMLDTAGKILERIICDRLEAFTERPGGLSE